MSKVPALLDLIAQMTLAEKVGQLNFVVGDLFITGPTMKQSTSDKFDDQIRSGEITGLFNIYGESYIHRLQKIAQEESRLGIPLLIGADVIHGFKTVFPIPLAEAASWNLGLIERTAQIAAKESTAAGIHFNFAPMCDISRDARWGRVAEGAGEDPYLGGLIAERRVRGFQGDDLSKPDTMAACVKHWAAYGAPEGGRDYQSVDMSEHLFRSTYLPPYLKALEAGAATVMTAFHDFNGVPCTANSWLLKTLLREELNFDGVVVSDWGSIAEVAAHGAAEDDAHATLRSFEAGTDLDMMSEGYLKYLIPAIKEGKIQESVLDEAVYRILKLKYDLGLFDDPMKYGNREREKFELKAKDHLSIARQMAQQSFVLLKNEGSILPLKKDAKVALIGPLADNAPDMNGTWSFFAEPDDPVTIKEGLIEAGVEVQFAQGCELHHSTTKHFPLAKETVKQSDVVVMVLGESAVMNGEAASRTELGLPDNQLELFREIKEMGKPLIVLLSCGRPLVIPELAEEADALMVIWSPGSEAGHAVGDVLVGDVVPSGKLPMTFPNAVGQIPIHYQMKRTGRPYLGNYDEPASERIYLSKYRDAPNEPLFPFGYGLSYTKFELSDLRLSQAFMEPGDSLEVSVNLTNTGLYDGTEVVQLYISDIKASITPVAKALKAFERVTLPSGESCEVKFTLEEKDFQMLDKNMRWIVEPGDFEIFVGRNADEGLIARLEWTL